MWRKISVWLGWSGHGHEHGHGHRHDDHGHSHAHVHGAVDPGLLTTQRGIWAIKWSFAILAATAVLQIFVVWVSGSVALLADTIHNIGDAATAIPLWVAFRLAPRRPTPTFNYGFGRAEDIAGAAVVLIIFISAVVAGYEAIDRFLHPQPLQHLEWLALAGLAGFIGNEAVAVLRIRVGRQINSAALIADGYHARTDGLTSLAVVAGAVGVWLGFPLADPIIGVLITLAIFGIVWQSGRTMLRRMLDGIEPGVLDDIRHAIGHVAGVKAVVSAKARWVGHRLHADVELAVDDRLTVASAETISDAVRHELRAHLPALAAVNVCFKGG